MESSHVYLQNPQAIVARFKQRSVQFNCQVPGSIISTEIRCFVASSIIPGLEKPVMFHHLGLAHGPNRQVVRRNFTHVIHNIPTTANFSPSIREMQEYISSAFIAFTTFPLLKR
jgi:hypothetical protein